MKTRLITFSCETVLESADGQRFHFLPNVPFEVTSLRVDYKLNQFHFVHENDLFEFVPLNDTKIDLGENK